MKPMTAILLLLAILLPGAIVLSGNRPWPDSWNNPNAVQIDGQIFSAMPADRGDSAIREHARNFVKMGGKIMDRSRGLPAMHQPGFPAGFRPEHTLRFEANRKMREIRTGVVLKPADETLFPGSKGWEYHETGSGFGLAMAKNKSGGGKSIVLIDRNRKTFLSISN